MTAIGLTSLEKWTCDFHSERVTRSHDALQQWTPRILPARVAEGEEEEEERTPRRRRSIGTHPRARRLLTPGGCRCNQAQCSSSSSNNSNSIRRRHPSVAATCWWCSPSLTPRNTRTSSWTALPRVSPSTTPQLARIAIRRSRVGPRVSLRGRSEATRGAASEMALLQGTTLLLTTTDTDYVWHASLSLVRDRDYARDY